MEGITDILGVKSVLDTVNLVLGCVAIAVAFATSSRWLGGRPAPAAPAKAEPPVANAQSLPAEETTPQLRPHQDSRPSGPAPVHGGVTEADWNVRFLVASAAWMIAMGLVYVMDVPQHRYADTFDELSVWERRGMVCALAAMVGLEVWLMSDGYRKADRWWWLWALCGIAVAGCLLFF